LSGSISICYIAQSTFIMKFSAGRYFKSFHSYGDNIFCVHWFRSQKPSIKCSTITKFILISLQDTRASSFLSILHLIHREVERAYCIDSVPDVVLSIPLMHVLYFDSLICSAHENILKRSRPRSLDAILNHLSMIVSLGRATHG
jgi:hypothetical protein